MNNPSWLREGNESWFCDKKIPRITTLKIGYTSVNSRTYFVDEWIWPLILEATALPTELQRWQKEKKILQRCCFYLEGSDARRVWRWQKLANVAIHVKQRRFGLQQWRHARWVIQRRLTFDTAVLNDVLMHFFHANNQVGTFYIK